MRDHDGRADTVRALTCACSTAFTANLSDAAHQAVVSQMFPDIATHCFSIYVARMQRSLSCPRPRHGSKSAHAPRPNSARCWDQIAGSPCREHVVRYARDVKSGTVGETEGCAGKERRSAGRNVSRVKRRSGQMIAQVPSSGNTLEPPANTPSASEGIMIRGIIGDKEKCYSYR